MMEERKIKEFDSKVLYDFAEIITNTAIKDMDDYYDEIYESIIEKATFQNYEDLIDEKVNELEKELDKKMSTFFERYMDDIKELLSDWGYSENEIQGFLERQADTIFYMYEHDILFFTKENLEHDVLEKLDEWKETLISKINGLLSNKFDDCFYGTLFIYINDLEVTISNRNDLELEDYKLAGKVIGYGLAGVEINFDYRGANITYYGCLSKYGFDYQEDLYF
jgi:hypothetical protein